MTDGERISASMAHKMIRKAGVGTPHWAICGRANDGVISSFAKVLCWGHERREESPIPKEFWWARGDIALDQNWETGDFETWIDQSIHCRAYGVTFLRTDIEAMIPEDVRSPNDEDAAGRKGGRKRSKLWDDWIVELAWHIHEAGIPEGSGVEGQDEMIAAIDTKLQEHGLEGPARSTLQPVVRAILLRLRQAEN